MICEARAQTSDLDFEATLQCFLRFFTCRLFFKRVGALERKSMEKSVNLIAGVAKIGEKSLQDLANAPKNHENWRIFDNNSIVNVKKW